MPMYEFQCPECDCRYEKILTLKEYCAKCHCCPECGKTGDTVLYAPAVHMRYSNLHSRHMRGQRGKNPKIGRPLK